MMGGTSHVDLFRSIVVAGFTSPREISMVSKFYSKIESACMLILRPWPYQILMEDGKLFDIEM